MRGALAVRARARDTLNAACRLALRSPVATLLILALTHHVASLDARDLWWSDEVRHAAVLSDMVQSNRWIALRLNDALYPDKPPLYFWFLRGLAALFGGVTPMVFFTGLAITVALFHLSIYALGRALELDRRTSLLAALIPATMPYVVVTAHYARMDFLFSAAIAIAMAGLYRGMRGADRSVLTIAGFAMAALATLIKGPIGALLPLAGLVAWLAWRGRLKRLFARDVATGLSLPLLSNAAWLLALWQAAGTDFVRHLVQSQIIDRALHRSGGFLDYGRYLVTLPLVGMPWTLALALRAKELWASLPAGRSLWRNSQSGDPAFQFLIAQLCAGFLLLTFVREKHEYYLLPLIAPLALLSAHVVLTMAAGKRARAISGCALVVAAMAVGLALFDRIIAIPTPIAGRWEAVAILCAGGAALWRLRETLRSAFVSLLVTMIVWNAVVTLRIMPSLDAVFSPRRLVEAIDQSGASRNAVSAFWFTPGTLRYHLGVGYQDEYRDEVLRDWLSRHSEGVALVPVSALPFIPLTQAIAIETLRISFAGDTIVLLRRKPA